MLSSIGRAAIRRVGTGAGSTNKFLQTTWRVDVSTRTQFALSLRRFLATSLKTTKTVGKVSKNSTKPNPKTKKTVVRGKTATAKAVKKKPVKKVVKKKVAAKPKKKPRKVATPAEIEKAHIKELKAAALLTAPKRKPQTAWLLVSAEECSKGTKVIDTNKVASARYKSLSPAEIEQFNHIANENKVQNAIAFKTWLESHTPDQIRIANNARKQLQKKKTSKTLSLLRDERIPKRPVSAFAYFLKDRFSSGDFKGIALKDAVTIMRNEFIALPASELKVLKDKQTASRLRYEQEFKTVFHRDTPKNKRANNAD